MVTITHVIASRGAFCCRLPLIRWLFICAAVEVHLWVLVLGMQLLLCLLI